MRHSPFPGAMTWFLHMGCMLALALAIALLVLWLLKRRKGAHSHHAPGTHSPGQHGWQPGGPPGPQPFAAQPPANALQILDERLARGDIDVDDYLTRRSALLGDRPNGTEFAPGGQPPQPPRPPEPPRPRYGEDADGAL